MRAVRLHTPDGPAGLVLEELDTPVPGAGEALVRVHAAAITRDELDWPVDRLPAIPLAALSAWQGLFEHGQLASGQRVLVHGAAGGVGGFAVQLAHWRRAFVTGDRLDSQPRGRAQSGRRSGHRPHLGALRGPRRAGRSRLRHRRRGPAGAFGRGGAPGWQAGVGRLRALTAGCRGARDRGGVLRGRATPRATGGDLPAGGCRRAAGDGRRGLPAGRRPGGVRAKPAAPRSRQDRPSCR